MKFEPVSRISFFVSITGALFFHSLNTGLYPRLKILRTQTFAVILLRYRLPASIKDVFYLNCIRKCWRTPTSCNISVISTRNEIRLLNKTYITNTSSREITLKASCQNSRVSVIRRWCDSWLMLKLFPFLFLNFLKFLLCFYFLQRIQIILSINILVMSN